MMYALSDDKRIQAAPGISGTCPLCRDELISKCGEIKIWHWAHKKGYDCDDFRENESEWHRNWKEAFPPENREVFIRKGADVHIADVKTHYQMVIEFQNSSLSFDQMKAREYFYGQMIWIFNCQKSVDRIERKGNSINWFAPRRDFTSCRNPVFLDLGDEMFRVGEVHKERDGDIPLYTISGEWIPRSEFIEQIKVIPRHLDIVCPGINPPFSMSYRWCHHNRILTSNEMCQKPYWPWEREGTCQQWKYTKTRFSFAEYFVNQ